MATRPTTALAARNSDDRLVDAFIVRVNDMLRQSLIDTVIAVGDDLIETFFGGDLELARSHSPQKDRALLRLYERANELPISVHALKRSIRLSLQYRELPPSLRKVLSVRHQIALLPVASPGDKVKLAESAVARALTSDQLTQAVRHEAGRQPRARSSGRPVLPLLVKHLSAIERATRAQSVTTLLAPGAVRALDAAAVALLERQLRAVREHVERISDALARAKR